MAPSSIAICTTSAVNSTSERVASIGENSTSSRYSLRVRHRRARLALDVLARGLQLVHDVDVRRRDERVDARALCVAHRLPRRVDVRHVRARQARDDRRRRIDHLARDRLHRLEVARRGDRKTGLDHVDPQTRQLLGDLQLLGACSARSPATARRRAASCRRSGRGARRVSLRVAGSVSACSHVVHAPSTRSLSNFLQVGLRLRGRHALFPPRGEEEKSKRKPARHASRRLARSPESASRSRR